uniref:Uncharacterized protein n=1 Tax=Mimivirus LCMiAC02 TaxID=2506609 RepID=A0A481Z3T6_9VIRU|nr:MAG: hypothetical protein LCMiAC02_01590 [Mimivirus LCMiAC02]
MNLSINRESRPKRKRDIDIFDPAYIPVRKKRCMYSYHQNCRFLINETLIPQTPYVKVGGFTSDLFNVLNKVDTQNREPKTKRKRKRKQETDIFDSITTPFRKKRCTDKYYERKRKRKRSQKTDIFNSNNIPPRKRRCIDEYYQYKCWVHNNDSTICGIYDCTGFTESQYEQMKNNIPEWSYII